MNTNHRYDPQIVTDIQLANDHKLYDGLPTLSQCSRAFAVIGVHSRPIQINQNTQWRKQEDHLTLGQNPFV